MVMGEVHTKLAKTKRHGTVHEVRYNIPYTPWQYQLHQAKRYKVYLLLQSPPLPPGIHNVRCIWVNRSVAVDIFPANPGASTKSDSEERVALCPEV